NNLSATGIVGPITWNVLFLRHPNVWPVFPGVVLRRGMQGPSIRQAQEKLNELGAFPRLSGDGVFGPLTEAAVISFQKINNLNPDGIVGSNTWNTLFGHHPIPFPKRMIALTFDDGPGHNTERLLDILERHGAQATFFVMGNLVEPRRDTIMRIANIGSEVAGHTWTHYDLRQLSDREIAETIQSTSAAIESVTGFSPRIYRPPFGFTNNNVRRVSGEIGYSIVLWTLDTLDWRYRDPNIVYHTVMNNAEKDDIVLLHDVHVTTVDAMERVIPGLIAEGFQLVTVSELLAYKYGELIPGMIYGVPRPISMLMNI
ncbi:MAG: polysaccharide deacetylase family protein, partial [Defluviitaleaceae bacterium]|nr:polysaccharide deacetylase family protein [Defluviitaleaceae bacterium]